MVRITHFRDKCIGCKYCEVVAPSNWIMDEADGKATLIGAKEKKGIYTLVTTDDDYAPNFEAADLCPVNVIRVEVV